MTDKIKRYPRQLPPLGQATSANSLPVVIASDQTPIPTTTTITPVPIEYRRDLLAVEVKQDTGTSSNNRPLPVQLIAGDGGAPYNGATETTASAINTKLVQESLSFGVITAGVRTAAQISNATGAADFGAGVVGTQTLRTIIASDQSAIPASQSGTWTVQAAQSGSWTVSVSGTVTVSGTVAATQSGTWNITNISGTISLPTGASTEAKQDTGNTSLASIDSKFGTLGQKNMAGSAPVTIASNQSAIPASQSGNWNILDISGTISLPTGASTLTAQNTGNASLSSLDTKAVQEALNYGVATGALRVAAQPGNASGIADFNAGTTGAQTPRASVNITRNGTELSYNTGASDANTQRVVLADESKAARGLAAIQLTSSSVFPYYQDFSSATLPTATWTQVIASLGSDVNWISVSNNSSSFIQLGVGAGASEVEWFRIPPGGVPSGIPLRIASGSRIAIKAATADITDGFLSISVLG